MKNRFLPIVALFIALTMILASCSQQENKVTKTEQPKKELTLVDVMTKSEENIAKSKGLSFKMEGTQSVNFQGNTIATDVNFDVNTTIEPKAIYAKGNFKVLGQEMPIEMYLLGNWMYEKVTDKWIKMKGFNLSQAGISGDEPSEMMKKLNRIIKNFSNKDAKGFTMVKGNGIYVITMDSSAVNGSKEFLDSLMKGVKENLNGLGEMKNLGGEVDFSKIKIESFKQVLYIDEKSFELRRVEQDSKISIPFQGQTFVVDQKIITTMNGSFDGKIEVPATVKKTAQAIDLQSIPLNKGGY